MRRVCLLGLLFIPLVASADLPQWKQVRLIGKVEPVTTAGGVTLGPGTGFGCVMKDETKPVESQDSPYDCDDVSTDIYLSDGKMLYPPVHANGTVSAGLKTTWSDWAESILGWGSNLENLKPSKDGTITAKLASSPLEGGCKPTKVKDKPQRDRKGERCLASHGEVTLQIGPAALLALSKQVSGLESGDDAGCPPNLQGCAQLAMLRAVATCSVCATGACDETECKTVHHRASLAEQAQVVKAGWQIVEDEEEISSAGHQVSELVKLLVNEGELLTTKDRTSLKGALGTKLAKSFDSHLVSGDTLAAGMALMRLEDLYGETSTNLTRRAKLEAKQASQQSVSSGGSRSSGGASDYRSRPLSDRLRCLSVRCPNCTGDDILDYGGDQQACLSAWESCAATCGCSNTLGNTAAEWCQ